jgi:hypothetical protein
MATLDAEFQLVLDRLAQLLLSQDYRQRGKRFYRATDDGWLIIDVQRSSTNDRNNRRFTINLGAASKRLDYAQSRTSQRGLRSMEDCHWRTRIGYVMPLNEDHWWELTRDTAVEGISNDVVRVMEKWGLPALDSVTTDEQLRDIWLRKGSPGLTDVQRLFNLLVLVAELGPPDKLDEVAASLASATRGKPSEHDANAAIARYAPAKSRGTDV